MLSHVARIVTRYGRANYATKPKSTEIEPWFKDGLKFACTGCGKCCTGASGHVWLTQTDIQDISHKLSIEPKAFLKQYARWIPRMGKWSLIEKNLSDDFHCIFLENGKLCSVYDVRPVQCRTFPYWPSVMESKETWLEEKSMCEGIENPLALVTPMETIVATLKWQEEDTEQTLQVAHVMTDVLANLPSSLPGSMDPTIAMQELVRLELQIQARIAAVRNASEASLSYQVVQEQNIKIKELFLEMEDKLQIWKYKSEEKLNVQEGLLMKEQVKRHQAELSNLKESLRKANLKVKLEREKQESLDRQKLLGNVVGSASGSQYGESKAQKRQIRTQEDALKESKNVIEGLKRLRNMMATEAQLGQEILVELDDQGKVIHSAVSDLDDMHGSIRRGRGWLSLLRRREVTDKLLISLALIFFCFVCFYIIKVRLRITFFGYWSW